MFIYHYDYLYQRWNVFQLVDERENYICWFLTADEAKTFCDAKNEVSNVSAD